MNPLVVLTAVFATAMAAPSNYATPALAVAQVAPAVAVPAPYTTLQQGAPTSTILQAAPVVTKQLHFGQTQFVSGQATEILKPATPVLPISVPTVLKGTVAQNPALVKIAKETHVVNEPYGVEKRIPVPYDAPVVREQLVEVAVPVPVDRPYAVPQPVAVQGEPIVNVRQTAPYVQHTHTEIQAPVAYAQAAPLATPLSYAQAPLAAPLAYAQAPLAAAPAAVYAKEY